MYKQSSAIGRLRSAIVIAGAAIAFTALPASAQKQLPMEPIHEVGQPVTPAFEGWWQDADGKYNFMFGYFNRNAKEEIEVPIGANNHFDPAGDYGQPTHFYPRRHWGVFVLTLPKEVAMGAKRPAWTLTANGLTSVIPVNPDPVYNINPLSEIGIGNTPPTISLDEKGPSSQGPKGVTISKTATVGTPLTFNVWAADDDKSLRPQAPPGAGRGRGGPGRAGAPPPAEPGGAAAPTGDAALAAIAASAGVDIATVREFMNRASVGITFEKFRGPGNVTFAANKPKVEKVDNGEIPKKEKYNGKTSTTATFSEPGEYVLRIYATDSSGEGGGGFLCCWTNIYAKVNVTK
jgi:hypothetical protein